MDKSSPSYTKKRNDKSISSVSVDLGNYNIPVNQKAQHVKSKAGKAVSTEPDGFTIVSSKKSARLAGRPPTTPKHSL